MSNLVPISTSIDVIREPNASFYLTISLKSRSFWFNASTIKKFDIIAGDRVGFLLDTKNDIICYIYFTTNPIGTSPIKKYKNSAYRVNNYCVTVDLSKIFRLFNDSNLKIYINHNISIKMNVNGKEENCYLLTTKVSEREDIDDFSKEIIEQEYAKIFKNKV